MTRPIVEPNTPRAQAGSEWSIQQLQRRPQITPAVTEFGVGTQIPYLPEFADSSNADQSGGIGFTFDNTSYGGGYVARTNPLLAADGDYFTFMALLSPIGSIWSFRYLHWVGPAYGKLEVEMASLGYDLAARPSGCPQGKVQPYNAAYGDALSYLNMGINTDGYNAVEQQVTGGFSDFVIEVGGQPGDPLTDFTDIGNECADGAGFDPFNSVAVMDGGPGWYRVKIKINGKNASSTGYNFRISSVAWSRVDDLGAI